MKRFFPVVVIDVHYNSLAYAEDMVHEVLTQAHKAGCTTANLVCGFIPSGKDEFGYPRFKLCIGERGAKIVVEDDVIILKDGDIFRHWVLDIDPRTMEL